MKGAYNDLAKSFKDDKDVGIGAIDCTIQENRSICGKYNV
jgi:hypothetical protein